MLIELELNSQFGLFSNELRISCEEEKTGLSFLYYLDLQNDE